MTEPASLVQLPCRRIDGSRGVCQTSFAVQNVVIDKPYRFVAPRHGDFWPTVFKFRMPAYLAKSHGVVRTEFLGTERLKASLDAGHGIMLAPNHCRPCDPMVLGLMAKTMLNRAVYIMASWHLFMQDRWTAWLLPRLGVFSVYREGLDREALKCAIDILVQAKRPLVIFPEGIITRTNDRLNHLMEGTLFMARNAAKQRAAMNPPGKVVIHPVAIRYFFEGNLESTLAPVLDEIEKRLSWQPQRHLALTDRIAKAGMALLTLKEIEHAGKPGAGTLAERLTTMVDSLLVPLETEWLKGKRESGVIGRVKALRTAILADMVGGDMAEEERTRRWRQLANIYLAQQLACYPPDYISNPPTQEQLLETVERFEEDLTDELPVHRPIRATVEVQEAIEVKPGRDRGPEAENVMEQIRIALESGLARLKEGRRPS